MTREEAIKYFKECNEKLVSVAKDENVYDYEKQVMEADCMRRTFESNEKAIKALEQEPILDKIRAEIKALPNANPSYSGYIDVVDREDVLEIIDKYKAESEE